MSVAITPTPSSEHQTIARPLNVLVPLIQDDLKRGRVAAEEAGLPYYRAAGEKLLEAKAQLAHGEFLAWVSRHFQLKIRQAQIYMSLAQESQKRSAPRFSSLSDFVRQTSNPNYNRPSSWHEPVRKVINRVDTETLNLKREELNRAEEREAQRELALRLIDIGEITTNPHGETERNYFYSVSSGGEGN